MRLAEPLTAGPNPYSRLHTAHAQLYAATVRKCIPMHYPEGVPLSCPGQRWEAWSLAYDGALYARDSALLSDMIHLLRRDTVSGRALRSTLTKGVPGAAATWDTGGHWGQGFDLGRGRMAQFWVSASATNLRNGAAVALERGPYDGFTLARIGAESIVPPEDCRVENATVVYNGVEVVGYRSYKPSVSWRWDPAPAEWESVGV